MKVIMIDNPDINTWRNYIPYGAEDLYHFCAYKTGYLHYVGVRIRLTPICDGETPRGWNTADQQLTEAMEEMANSWELATQDWAASFRVIK